MQSISLLQGSTVKGGVNATQITLVPEKSWWRERERERQTDRQTDRQTERQRARENGGGGGGGENK